MIFIDNKYTRIYYNIIERAKSRTLSEDTYTERHHVIPRSLGGSDTKDNLAILTAREHFICHWLLPHMLEGESRYKMLCAILRMAHSNQLNRVNVPSRVYENTKIAKAKLHSELFRGERNPFYGMTHSEETKQRLREARMKQVDRQGSTMTAEARDKLSKAAKGRVLTESHKKKIREKALIRFRCMTLEEKQKLSEKQRGKKIPEKTKEKLRIACREAASRDSKPYITCPHCGKSGGMPSMKRWHFDNCRSLLLSSQL